MRTHHRRSIHLFQALEYRLNFYLLFIFVFYFCGSIILGKKKFIKKSKTVTKRIRVLYYFVRDKFAKHFY